MHNLDFSTGTAAIAYRGETPWHGYGFAMQPGASIEEWRKAAQLEWEIQRRRVFTRQKPDSPMIEIPGMDALVRSDNGHVLSVVGDRYKVVQPAEVLEFFRDLVKDQGFEIETAGALADGARVWALAKTGDTFKLGGVDPVMSYLLLATSYDKKFATTAQFTSVRVVCNNTLTMSLANTDSRVADGDTSVFRVPHCTTFDAAVAKGSLGLLGSTWSRFTHDIDRLARTPISKEDAIKFFLELTGFDQAKTADDQSKPTYLAKKLLQSYVHGPGQQLSTAEGTLWGVVNAVTHFTDHMRRASNNGTRLNSAWFGTSAGMKRDAWNKAIELADAA